MERVHAEPGEQRWGAVHRPRSLFPYSSLDEELSEDEEDREEVVKEDVGEEDFEEKAVEAECLRWIFGEAPCG